MDVKMADNERRLREVLELVQQWFKATKGHWTYPMSAFGWEATEQLIDNTLAAVPEKPSEEKPPRTLMEFQKRLMNDPVAYAYYNMGRAVERDVHMTPEQRARKNFDAIYSAVQQGFAEQILPDIWFAELAAADAKDQQANGH